MPAFDDVSWSERVDAAVWVRERLAPFRTHVVTSIVPAGFDAYARLLHPVPARNSLARLRWRDVAAWSGAPLRADAQFHSVALPPERPAGEPRWGGPPEEGAIDPADGAALAEILRRETSTPEACWFCLWEGFGWVGEVVPEAAWSGPRVRLPGRNYLLYAGPVEAVILTSRGGGSPANQSANLWWPEDRAWCVATEIDLPWTYVAGTGRLVERVLGDPRLETLPAAPGDALTHVEPWVQRWVDDATSELMRSGTATILTPAGNVEAWLDPPRAGRPGELRMQSPGSWGSSKVSQLDPGALSEAIASSLTWRVEELAGR